MSMKIDETRPFTEEEKEYLLTRDGGEQKIANNDLMFPKVTDKKKAELQDRARNDDAEEERLKREQAEAEAQAEEDSYHPDDIAEVEPMTVKDLRMRLEKLGLKSTVSEKDKEDPEDPDSPFTEKEVLVIRLLDYLTDQREEAEKTAAEQQD